MNKKMVKEVEGATPETEKTGTQPNLALGLGIGMLFGISIGSAMDNMGAGIAIGMGFGCSLGLLFEKRNEQKAHDGEAKDGETQKEDKV